MYFIKTSTFTYNDTVQCKLVNYQTDRVPLYDLFITENNYRQFVSLYTTDSKIGIDHIYTNLPESQAKLHLLETYFSDHKAICALINSVNTET